MGKHVLFTPREREIITLVSEGKTSKEIGELLGISYKTVDCHRHAIYIKLGITNLEELRKARVAKLVQELSTLPA